MIGSEIVFSLKWLVYSLRDQMPLDWLTLLGKWGSYWEMHEASLKLLVVSAASPRVN